VRRRLGALALTDPSLDRSLLLAAAAVRTGPSPETEGDLLSALLRSPHALAQVRGNSRLQDLAPCRPMVIFSRSASSAAPAPAPSCPGGPAAAALAGQ
jgi:hypothetical protein